MRARILVVEVAGEEVTMAEGRVIETVWVVASCTYRQMNRTRDRIEGGITDVSLLVIMHVDEDLPFDLVFVEINDVL